MDKQREPLLETIDANKAKNLIILSIKIGDNIFFFQKKRLISSLSEILNDSVFTDQYTIWVL